MDASDRGDLLRSYAAMPDELEALLNGVTEAQLDRARSPGSWSPRQVVHHIADGEAVWLAPIKLALADSGRVYRHNDWKTERYASTLASSERDIAPSLALFRAQRAHVVQLVRAVPDAWDRYVMLDWRPDYAVEPQRRSVADSMEMGLRHISEHLDQIRRNLAHDSEE